MAERERVFTSPFITGSVVVMEGVNFPDGKRRVCVPEGTDESTIAEAIAVLEAHDAKLERMQRIMTVLGSLTPGGSERG